MTPAFLYPSDEEEEEEVLAQPSPNPRNGDLREEPMHIPTPPPPHHPPSVDKVPDHPTQSEPPRRIKIARTGSMKISPVKRPDQSQSQGLGAPPFMRQVSQRKYHAALINNTTPSKIYPLLPSQTPSETQTHSPSQPTYAMPLMTQAPYYSQEMSMDESL